MAKNITVTVPANPDLDDCLAGAAAAYIEEHPELEGYDLAPRWTDEDDRETVTLTVPFPESRVPDLLAALSRYDHGDGCLGIIVREALRLDPEATAEDIAETIREAEAEAAAEVAS